MGACRCTGGACVTQWALEPPGRPGTQRAPLLCSNRRQTNHDPSPHPIPACSATPRSQLIAAVQGGQLAPREAVAQLRLLCEAAVASNWHGGRKDAAQTASELLDEANEALEEVPGLKDGPDAAPAPPPPPPGAAAKPRLPAETFFLPLDEAVRRCLTLNIDASILQHALPSGRRGGWPLGKRRKEGGSTGGGEACCSRVQARRGCAWLAAHSCCALPAAGAAHVC